MNNNDTIDILMATYNGAKNLSRQIESILNQTHSNINLIISDDCSKDDTVEILKKYESLDDRIKVYVHNENMGSTKNFEFLLSKVTSKYFMFSDQDDVWYEFKVKDTYECIKENDSDLVFTDLHVADEKLNIINDSFNTLKKLKYKINKYSDYRLEYLYNTITGCTIMCKSDRIKDFTPFPTNKNVIHDAWMGLILSIKGKISYLDKPTLMYVQHSNNQIGAKRYTDQFENFKDVRKHFIDIKLSRFNEFKARDNVFNDELKKLNDEAIKYYNSIAEVKFINFKYIRTFHKLYKWDSLSYYIIQYIVMNVPFIAKFIYNVKSKVSKG